jgi:AbrB family looped-hinge helix DNA binding protein
MLINVTDQKGAVGMTIRKKKVAPGSEKELNCCKVESIISVDERGQMVLPKDLRDKAKIKAGDKFALVSWDKDGEVCCLYLIKTDYLAETVKGFLSPVTNNTERS